MAKVMLVEDDNNLREIYEARLAAEGYEIVSAHDGEEALALAVKEQPDLIISDIMMPKISGFDMLDILRSTPETKDTKVIMMTALSQAEDQDRADKLGADRYLVKSQVTLEDVVRVTKELLEGPAAPTAFTSAEQPAATSNAPAPTMSVDSPVVAAPADDQSITTDAPAPAPAVNDDVTDASTDTTTAPAVSDDATADNTVVDDSEQTTPTAPDSPAPADQPVAVAPEPSTANAEPEVPAENTATPSETPEPAPVVPETETQLSETVEPEAAPEEAPDTGSTADPTPTETPTTNVEDQIRDFITTAEQVKNNASTPAATTASTTQIPVTTPDSPTPEAAPTVDATAAPQTDPTVSSPTPQPQLATPSGQKKVIEPINDLSKKSTDLDALLAKEESKPADTTTPIPSVNTVISPDGTLTYASPPPAADVPETTTMNTDTATNSAGTEPHQPGQKIDPDSIAL